MKKSLSYAWSTFSLSWKANGIHAIISIIGELYDNTFYPLIQIFLLAQFLDLLAINASISFRDIIWIILTYFVASVLKLILKSTNDIRDAYLQSRLEGYIELQINKKLSNLDPATFENPEFQNLLAQLEGVQDTIYMHLLRFTGILNAVFKFITATIVVSATFPIFAPIILVATIPSFLVWERTRAATMPFYVEKRSFLTRITGYVKNLLSTDSTSKETIIFKTEKTLITKITSQQKKYYEEFSNVNNPWIMRIFLTRLFQFSVFVYTQYLNLSRVFAGTLSIGSFALVFQQSLNLALSAEEILNMYSSMAARNRHIDRYLEFMNTTPMVESPEKPRLIPQTSTPPVIEFRNVFFKYPSTDRYIFKNFSLTLQSGEKIALVGENGTGKTTLIKLLLRFYDVTEGEVLINGVNVKDISLDEWYKQVGALFQDFIKYQFTFKENVYLGDLTRKKQEKILREALEKSGASAFVDKLPQGIDQVVGKMFEGGVDLSGGQWQKLALARAFYRDAPVLILDEPTSAIDAKAEYEIFQNVQKLQNDKTVIIISHRFSTVRHADRIIVLEEGAIVEEGKHHQLMKKQGLYAELFEIQAQGYSG